MRSKWGWLQYAVIFGLPTGFISIAMEGHQIYGNAEKMRTEYCTKVLHSLPSHECIPMLKTVSVLNELQWAVQDAILVALFGGAIWVIKNSFSELRNGDTAELIKKNGEILATRNPKIRALFFSLLVTGGIAALIEALWVAYKWARWYSHGSVTFSESISMFGTDIALAMVAGAVLGFMYWFLFVAPRSVGHLSSRPSVVSTYAMTVSIIGALMVTDYVGSFGDSFMYCEKCWNDGGTCHSAINYTAQCERRGRASQKALCLKKFPVLCAASN